MIHANSTDDEIRGFFKYPRYWPANLLQEDIEWIESNAIARNENGTKLGLKTKTINKSNVWDISGLAGEWATSLVLNIPITRITGNRNEIKNDSDLAFDIEVKTSRYIESRFWNLVVDEDHLKDNRPYVNCLTGWYPRWVIVQGWAWGHEIHNDGRKSTPSDGRKHKIYIYDQSLLKNMNDLMDVMR